MKLLHRLSELFFPPKCVLCGGLLQKEEMDLCRSCRTETEEAPFPREKHTYLDRWTSLWYYDGSVRRSILKFKFYGARSYAASYGRLLAMKLVRDEMDDFDILTWVPISPLRRWHRGYDQVELIALSAGRELGVQPTALLKKVRHVPPQSGISGEAERRANVLGAYRVKDPAAVKGKRILLMDDVITTGATAGECARVLLTAGAKCVSCAAVARRREK